MARKKYCDNRSNIKRDIKARGVQDSSLLPFYHYRDDGIKIWDARTTYVNSIIDLSYHDDKSVKEVKSYRALLMISTPMGFLHMGAILMVTTSHLPQAPRLSL